MDINLTNEQLLEKFLEFRKKVLEGEELKEEEKKDAISYIRLLRERSIINNKRIKSESRKKAKAKAFTLEQLL